MKTGRDFSSAVAYSLPAGATKMIGFCSAIAVPGSTARSANSSCELHTKKRRIMFTRTRRAPDPHFDMLDRVADGLPCDPGSWSAWSVIRREIACRTLGLQKRARVVAIAARPSVRQSNYTPGYAYTGTRCKSHRGEPNKRQPGHRAHQ